MSANGPESMEEPIAPEKLMWRRAVLLVISCAALAMLAASPSVHDALIETLAAITDLISAQPVYGVGLFVISAALSAMLAFVSVAVVVPAAILAWGRDATVLLLWCGWTLGGVLAYGVGSTFGRVAVQWLTGKDALPRFERRIERDAPFWLVLVFQLALPSELPGYVLGLARYSFPRYLAALAIAELPYAIATTYIGTGFIERQSGVILGAGAAIAGLGVAALWLFRREMRTPAIGRCSSRRAAAVHERAGGADDERRPASEGSGTHE